MFTRYVIDGQDALARFGDLDRIPGSVVRNRLRNFESLGAHPAKVVAIEPRCLALAVDIVRDRTLNLMHLGYDAGAFLDEYSTVLGMAPLVVQQESYRIKRMHSAGTPEPQLRKSLIASLEDLRRRSLAEPPSNAPLQKFPQSKSAPRDAAAVPRSTAPSAQPSRPRRTWEHDRDLQELDLELKRNDVMLATQSVELSAPLRIPMAAVEPKPRTRKPPASRQRVEPTPKPPKPEPIAKREPGQPRKPPTFPNPCQDAAWPQTQELLGALHLDVDTVATWKRTRKFPVSELNGRASNLIKLGFDFDFAHTDVGLRLLSIEEALVAESHAALEALGVEDLTKALTRCTAVARMSRCELYERASQMSGLALKPEVAITALPDLLTYTPRKISMTVAVMRHAGIWTDVRNDMNNGHQLWLFAVPVETHLIALGHDPKSFAEVPSRAKAMVVGMGLTSAELRQRYLLEKLGAGDTERDEAFADNLGHLGHQYMIEFAELPPQRINAIELGSRAIA